MTKQYEQNFTLNQVALMLDVHRDTIMYWEENELIPPARRNEKNKYRIYNTDEILEIAKIRGISVVDLDAVERQKERKRAERRKKKNEGFNFNF
ncbi:MerR family transcriptional regulator [Bacillus sp. ILBB4]|nr:MerR family transcriptional regulator [Bacillus sp. ILBB4]